MKGCSFSAKTVITGMMGLLLCCSACTASPTETSVPAPSVLKTSLPQSAAETEKSATPTDIEPDVPTVMPVETNASNLEDSTEASPNISAAMDVPPTLTATSPSNPQQQPAFDRFVEQVKNGIPNQIVGVYIEDVLALRVVQQPPEDPNYVSNVNGVATQFLLAYQISGNIGLLAHNYLSGSLFFNIKNGDIVQLIYGDGSVDEYVVSEYHEYQALAPDSPNSDFIDLTSGEKITAGELFNRIYTGSHRLVFQTCIAQDDIDTWGRLFVISFPY